MERGEGDSGMLRERWRLEWVRDRLLTVSTTHPAVACESCSAMEITPIVKDDGLARFELNPQFELFLSQNSRPLTSGAVPLLDGLEASPGLRVSVVIVPPYLRRHSAVVRNILLEVIAEFLTVFVDVGQSSSQNRSAPCIQRAVVNDAYIRVATCVI